MYMLYVLHPTLSHPWISFRHTLCVALWGSLLEPTQPVDPLHVCLSLTALSYVFIKPFVFISLEQTVLICLLHFSSFSDSLLCLSLCLSIFCLSASFTYSLCGGFFTLSWLPRCCHHPPRPHWSSSPPAPAYSLEVFPLVHQPSLRTCPASALCLWGWPPLPPLTYPTAATNK